MLAKGQSVGWALLHLPMQNGEVLSKIRKQSVTLGRRCLFCPCSGQGLSCSPAVPTAAGLDSGFSLCHSLVSLWRGKGSPKEGSLEGKVAMSQRGTAFVQSLGESHNSPPHLHGTPCWQGVEVRCTFLGYIVHLPPPKAVASIVLKSTKHLKPHSETLNSNDPPYTEGENPTSPAPPGTPARALPPAPLSAVGI